MRLYLLILQCQVVVAETDWQSHLPRVDLMRLAQPFVALAALIKAEEAEAQKV